MTRLRSAGLLLWRRTPAGAVEVLLAHPGGPLFARKDVWGVPQGELDPDEDALVAAYREFTEEVGTAPPKGDPVPLGEARQPSGKVNVVWALEGDLAAGEARSNHFSMEWPPRSGRVQSFPEVDRVGWFTLQAARERAFPSQLPFLDRLAALLVAD